MQTVAASVILDDLYRLMEWDDTQLESRQKGNARMALSLALQEAWEAWWWEELMTVDPQPLRSAYSSATTYAAGAEVYFPATQKYYQCLQGNLSGQAPALLVDGAYALNTAFWVEAAMTLPEAMDYVAGEAYAIGAVARFSGDGGTYIRLGGVTITGAGTTAANVSVRLLPTLIAGRASYSSGPNFDVSSITLFWKNAGTQWVLAVMELGECYLGIENVATPDLVTAWTVSYGSPPAPTVDRTGAPGDAKLWGAWNPFVPTLNNSKTVRLVSRLDPRQTRNPGPYEFLTVAEGVQLLEIPEQVPWVWARRVTPVLTGDDYSASTAYTATAADNLVFDS